jgi:hypothetical protein
VAASGPEHFDTVPSYYTTDYQLTHAYTRQLLSASSLTAAGAAWHQADMDIMRDAAIVWLANG